MTKQMQIALGLLLALASILAPVIAQPHMAPAILLHGPTGVLAIVALFVCAAMAVRARRNPAGNGARHPAGMTVALAAVGFALFTLWRFVDYRHAAAIRAHGERSDATVVSIYTDSCGRNGCSINVAYSFTPDGGVAAGQERRGYARLTSDRYPNDWRLVAARNSGHVPIAYDRNDPRVSRLNFADSAFAGDPWRGFAVAELILGGGLGVGVLLTLAFARRKAGPGA